MSDTRHRRISWTGEPDTCAVCGTEWPCDGNRADPDTGTDQTPTPDAIVPSPEARLAAALDRWWNWNEEDDRPRTHHAPVEDISPRGVAASLLRSDPTIARHMALGAVVERLRDHPVVLIERTSDGWWNVTAEWWSAGVVPYREVHSGRATDLDAAIEEALRDD